MMTGAPRATIVIPTRDREDLLRRCLRSALAQTGIDVEVVVVDDGSVDGTGALLAGIGDPRLRVLGAGGGGVSAARNLGLEHARGAWVAFVDDDDLLAPDAVARRVAAGEAAGAVLAYCAGMLVDVRGRPKRVEPAPAIAELPDRMRDHNALGGPTRVVLRRDAAAAVGGFDPAVSVLADWDLWLRVLERGPAAQVPEVLVAMTVHGANMQLAALAGLSAELERLRARHGVVGGPTTARWIAQRHRMSGRRRHAAGRFLRIAARGDRPAVDVARAASALVRGDVLIDAAHARALTAPAWLGPLFADR